MPADITYVARRIVMTHFGYDWLDGEPELKPSDQRLADGIASFIHSERKRWETSALLSGLPSKVMNPTPDEIKEGVLRAILKEGQARLPQEKTATD